MTNDSSTGGPLPALVDPSPYDYAYEDVLTALLAGVTGLDPNQYVRPAYQVNAPMRPPPGVDWLAFNVVDADTGAARGELQHNAPLYASAPLAQNPPGYSTLVEYENTDVLVSCYGPNSERTAKTIRAGLKIAQNREPLYNAGMGLTRVGQVQAMHELSGDTNQTTQRRWDCTLSLTRCVPTTYAIRNIVEAVGTLRGQGATPLQDGIDVETPPGAL